MKYSSILLSILLLMTSISHGQRLNRTEKKIVKRVESLNTESIAFLERVVNINSGTLNLNGVRTVSTFSGVLEPALILIVERGADLKFLCPPPLFFFFSFLPQIHDARKPSK